MATRQLAAIMFADIVGYTSMMQDDEVFATNLREKLKSKLDEEVKLHNGRVIKYSGDGALCSFDSAIESIRAALSVQLFMQEKPYVPLRIGIHQADVIFDEGDVHGDGVNIASRLESLAVPGSIFISGKVHDEIKNQKDIHAVLLGKYLLKNVKEPVEVYALSNTGIHVPLNTALDGKAVKYKEVKSNRKQILKFILPVLALIGVCFIFIPPWIKKGNARNKLLPEIQKLANENFRPPTRAYDLAMEAEKYIPGDSQLIKLWPAISTTLSMKTEPEGAEVYWKDYNKPNDTWRNSGATPLNDVRFPRSYLRMEIRKSGYQTIEYAGSWAYGRLGPEIDTLILDKSGTLPEDMVRIPETVTNMYIVGLEQFGGKVVAEYLMDKYEVSNKKYKIFIDGGGYTNKKFWNHPVYINEKLITPDSFAAIFTDRTGRPGPATWEGGTYSDGHENHPVTGVSWYEAAAYAAFSNKQLPTIFQWSRAAATSRTEFIVPLSNFSNKSTVDVGSLPGYSTFGIYDIAGNAREWCFNESNNSGQRFILGGGWNDPTYSFNDGYTQPASDRGIANGFRCVREINNKNDSDSLKQSITMAFRDYRKEKPVDDKTFEIFKRQFAYDALPLNANIDSVFENESWTAEKITFDAAYNKERMQAYVFLPKNFQKPYQAIIFFPGSGDIYSRKFDPQPGLLRTDFIVKSGRALVIPIYKGTHERHDELKSDLPEETVFYKDHVIMWRKDLGRTIDYLETRSDIQKEKIGFLGWSWGGFLGGILPAIEKRIKVVVLNVGGMAMTKTLPEVDQINFLPHVDQPVLMLNGTHDMFFPVETSQKPMFDFLGTPKDRKKMIIYESGHLVPRTDFVRESLNWYDKYLGPVK